MDPRRYDEGEATPFERHLFEAARRQVPSAALKARMQEGLGLAGASLSVPVAAKSLALIWKVGMAVGLVVVGAVVAVTLVVRDPGPQPTSRPAAQVPELRSVVPVASSDDPVQVGPSDAVADHSLMDEIQLLDGARVALTSANPRHALELLGRYEQRYPQGRFVPEVAVLRIQALSGVGETQAARALGQRFLAEYPNNPLAERVARIVGR